MATLDLRKEFKHLYQPSAKVPVLVEVPEMQFLMVDGRGDPDNSQEFQNAVMALYSVAYTLKFTAKKGPARRWITPSCRSRAYGGPMSPCVTRTRLRRSIAVPGAGR